MGAAGSAPVPSAPPAASPPPLWHVARGGESVGPVPTSQLLRWASEGELSRDTLVWTAGQDGWQRAEDVQELAQLFTVMPPPPPGV